MTMVLGYMNKTFLGIVFSTQITLLEIVWPLRGKATFWEDVRIFAENLGWNFIDSIF